MTALEAPAAGSTAPSDIEVPLAREETRAAALAAIEVSLQTGAPPDTGLVGRALAGESDPMVRARLLFHLARGHQAAGRAEPALEAYQSRAMQGHSDQEVFVSLLEAGRLMEGAGRDPGSILTTYAHATLACPTRAEAAHAASRYCRLIGLNAQGCDVALPCLDLTAPSDGLFVEPWIYEYGLRDEFAVNAFWAGRYHDALQRGLEVLASETLPAGDRARAVANVQFVARQVMAATRTWAEDAPVSPARRSLRSRLSDPAPRVLISILARQKAPVLPFFLRCIEALDYPKDCIVLSVRTHDNSDRTLDILHRWTARVGSDYAHVDFDGSDLPTDSAGAATRDRTATRPRTIRGIRDIGLAKVQEHDCDFLLAVDVDGFVVPSTLRDLVALDLPIVAPLLREAREGARYANYHSKVDANGYFEDTPRYDEILYRRIVGLFEQPVVHGTYLVRADVVPQLSYDDGTERLDYVIFSDRARRFGIPQFLDNRRLYGFMTLQGDRPEVVAEQIGNIEAWFAAPDETPPPY